MHRGFARRFFRILADERGSQNAKSAVGIFFFFVFVFGGALLNSSSLPLSYNIAFGDSGGGGGGGWGGGGGTGGYSYSQRTKARIDYLTLTVHYDKTQKETRSLGSVSNDVRVGGTGWLLPENAGREDTNRSIAEMTFGESSYYLKANNFGFKIPQTARITGITLSLKRSAEGPDVIRDYSVRLAVGGTVSGAEYEREEAWSAHDEFREYGGSNDAWGLNLTPSQVNNASFGVAIAARNGKTAIGTPSAAPAPASANTVNAQPQTETKKDIPASSVAKPAAKTASTPKKSPAQQPKISLPDLINGIKTPLVRGNSGSDVRKLQQLLIRLNIGPEAQVVGATGTTGAYGWRTERAVAELQNKILDAMKGPAAWRLANSFLKYGKGSWGDATKSATIEYVSNLR